MNVFCDGDACVIAHSEKALKAYILKMGKGKIKGYHIKKTRYGEILKGLQMGAAYAFDEKTYTVFYPLAKADGMNLFEVFQSEENAKIEDDGVPLKRVQWKSTT
jgi:hypothetical protein